MRPSVSRRNEKHMDRQVLGVLKTPLQHDLGWNEIDYSNLVFAFQAAYAVGMVAEAGSSIASAHVGGTPSRWSSGVSRRWGMPSAVVLELRDRPVSAGIWGSRVFPASNQDGCRVVFPGRRGRSPQSLNAGTNVGAILTPLFVPWIANHSRLALGLRDNWRARIAWMILWLLFLP